MTKRAIPFSSLGAWIVLSWLAGCSADRATGGGSGAEAPPARQELRPCELGDVANVHAVGDLLLAGQPQPADLARAREDGVRTVVNLRHPEETRGFDEERVVRDAGMGYVSLPFAGPAELTDAVFDRAREILRTAPRPLLLHCASANRVGAVWLPYRVLDEGVSPDQALAEAKEVGLHTPVYESKALDYVQRHR